MSETTVKLIGLIRDFLMAVAGVLILFHVNISDVQLAGIIGVVAPAIALGAFVYSNVSSPKGKL